VTKSKYNSIFVEANEVKELFSLFRSIAIDVLGFSIKINTVKKIDSGAYPADYNIVVNINQLRNQIVWDFFHELSHIKNYTDKKYYRYNNITSKTRMTKPRAMDIIRNGLRAEKFADKTGKILMKKYMPLEKALCNYDDKVIEVIFKNTQVQYAKDWLEERGYIV